MAVEVTRESDPLSVAREAVVRHGTAPEALIPILLEINERLGYLPAAALDEVGRRLNLPRSRLFGVASFYEMLSTRPLGRHVIRFCESAPCHVVGGRQLLRALCERLNLSPGQTSDDGQWTLLTASCPGLCAVGPVLVVDDDVYGKIRPEGIPEILARYERREVEAA